MSLENSSLSIALLNTPAFDNGGLVNLEILGGYFLHPAGEKHT